MSAGMGKAVDALQQLFGEYDTLAQMQRDAVFVAEPLIAEELRRLASLLDETSDAAKLCRRAAELDDDDVEEP